MTGAAVEVTACTKVLRMTKRGAYDRENNHGNIAVAVEQASLTIRNGLPLDEPEDLSFPAWAGLIPFHEFPAGSLPGDLTAAGTPLPG